MIRELATRGYRISDSEAGNPLKVVVQISDLSLSGYDLIVTRRPSASITVAAFLWRDGVLKKRTDLDDSTADYSKFAFSPQLSNTLSNLTADISKKICDELDIR